MIPLAVCLALGCTVLVILARASARRKKSHIDGLPEVPNGHWLFGHFHIFRGMLNSGDFGTCQRILAYDYANSDGLCTFRMLGKQWVSFTRPEAVRKVLTLAHHRDTSPPQTRHGSRLFGRRNLLSMRGREWRFWRTAVHRAFTPATLKGMQARMAAVASTLVESIANRIDDKEQSSSSTWMDVEELMKMVTLDTFGLTALGVDFRSSRNLNPSPVATAFDFLSSEMLRRIKTMYLPTSHFYFLPTELNLRHNRESAVIRSVLDEAVFRRRQQKRTQTRDGSEEDDLLAHLFRAVESAGTKTEYDISDEIFSDMLMGLLFAGYETTSITLTYCMYCLAKNPGVEKRALDEIHSVLGQTSSENAEHTKPIDPDQLPYCRAIIMETLRMYPPVIHTFRTLEEPIEISGYVISAGTQAFIPIWAIQRDGHTFPKPLEFIPERWDDNMSAECDVPPGDRNGFLCFSGGARSCIGRKFAMQEAAIILAQLLRNLKFEVDDDYVVEPFRAGLIQTPRGGMPMKISRRS